MAESPEELAQSLEDGEAVRRVAPPRPRDTSPEDLALLGAPTPVELKPVEKEETPPLGEVFGAVFTRNNTAAALIQSARFEKSFVPNGRATPRDFNPITYGRTLGLPREYDDQIGIMETYDEVELFAAKLEEENRINEVIAKGGVVSALATFPAVGLDPILMTSAFFLPTATARGARAVQGAVAGLAAEAAAESVLHSVQQTRTAGETGINLAGAAFMSAFFGAAFTKMPDADKAKLAANAEEDLGDMLSNVGGSAGARRVDETLPADESEVTSRLRKVLKATKADRISPLMRMMTVRSPVARDVTNRIAETPIQIEGNKVGTASKQAVETRIKARQADLAYGIDTMNKQHAAHKKAGGTLTGDEFRIRVGQAGRRGDVDEDPFVDAAAKALRPIRNRIYDDATEAGVIKIAKDDPMYGNTRFAESYVNRVYNQDAIEADPEAFLEIAENWARRAFPELVTTGGENTRRIAQDIKDQIMGLNPMQTIRTINVNLPSGSKARVFGVDDVEIEPFLHSDARYLLYRQFDDMIPQIELAREFGGDVQMTQAITDIKRDYADLVRKAKTQKEKIRLQREEKRYLQDLDAVRKIMTGEYALPADPGSFVVQANAGLLAFNYMTKLGGMTVSAMPDTARTTMRWGLGPALRGWGNVLTNRENWKMAKAELDRMGVGLDLVLNTRAKAQVEIGGAAHISSQLGNKTQRATEIFSKATLMAPWNAFFKKMAGMVTQDMILRAARNHVSGRGVKKSHRAIIANLGLDNEGLERVHRMFSKYGDDSTSLKLSQTHLWKEDPEIGEKLRLAILKDVDIQIVTPGVTDIPLFGRTQGGRNILQFRSFGFAATNRMMYAGLQQNDLAFYNGMILSMALGMFVHQVKSLNRKDGELDTDLGSLLMNGFDRTGFLGIYQDFNNILEKASGGRVGMSALTGNSPMSRYATRNTLGAILGPSAGLVDTLARFTGVVGNEGWNENDTHNARKLAPYNTIFYMRWLADKAEAGFNNAMGIEQ